MYGLGLDHAFCACSRTHDHMIFSGGREPEVEGDDCRVVVTDLFEKVVQKMEEEAGECSYPL